MSDIDNYVDSAAEALFGVKAKRRGPFDRGIEAAANSLGQAARADLKAGKLGERPSEPERLKGRLRQPIHKLIYETAKDVVIGHTDNVLDLVPKDHPRYKEMLSQAMAKDALRLPFVLTGAPFLESQRDKNRLIREMNLYKYSKADNMP